MKITRDSLHASDFDTLFTHDPATFFEAVVINIMWDKTPSSIDQELLARQKHIFLKWHEYFADNLKKDIEAKLAIEHQSKLLTAYNKGHHAGKIHALSTLPIKKNALGKSIDIVAVTEILRQLKAKEESYDY